MANSLCQYCGKSLGYRQAKFCSRRCYSLSRQHYKTCAICGKQFPCPPSDKVSTCSPACSAVYRRQRTSAEKIQDFKKVCAEFASSTPPEEWPTAKIWVLKDPNGEIYKCKNLIQFFRDHTHLIDGTPKQAAKGIVVVKASITGSRKRNKAYHWKGWTLLSWDDCGVSPRKSKNASARSNRIQISDALPAIGRK